MALASLFGFIGGPSSFLLAFSKTIPPYFIFLFPLYPIIVSYAVIRYQLLDIRVVIKKSLVYSILIAMITLSYLLIVLVAEKFLRDMMGYSSFFVSAFMAFLVGIFFFPLRNKIQYTVDRSFFKGTQAEIAEQNVLLRREVEDKEKFKAVATMASGMAHEIRNPLTAIKTFAEYLPVKKDDPLFLDNFSRIVGKEVERINSLVTNLLEFSRPLPLQIREMDLHALLIEILNYLNNELIRFKIRVEKNFPEGEPLSLQADPNQLRQVFLNLFINAIQAMPCGGMLSIATQCDPSPVVRRPWPVSRVTGDEPRVTDHESRATHVVITITDTGCGIDPKDLKHIFDPFFTKKEKGTGLGLAIVQGIIEDHKGKIRVESKLGQGTSFILEFPAANL